MRRSLFAHEKSLAHTLAALDTVCSNHWARICNLFRDLRLDHSIARAEYVRVPADCIRCIEHSLKLFSCGGTSVGYARLPVHNFSIFNFVFILSFVSIRFVVLCSARGRVHKVRKSRIRRDHILFLRFYSFSLANLKSNCKMINGSLAQSLTHTGAHTYAERIECVSSICVGNCFLIANVANTEIGTSQLHVSIIVIC